MKFTSIWAETSRAEPGKGRVATSFEKITHFEKKFKVRSIWNQLNAL